MRTYLTLPSSASLWLSSLIISVGVQASASHLSMVEAPIDGYIQVHIEIADTLEKRRLGLMNRTHLKENEGLLLVFESSQQPQIWAKGISMDLDVAFLSEKGVLLSVKPLKSHPQWNIELENSPTCQRNIDQKFLNEALRAPENSRFVLEMPKGWFENRHIQTGDCLVWNSTKGLISQIGVLRQNQG